MIAMAIASNPDLLVLDEPTTALDVTVQSQILDLIMGLKEKMRLSILFISHDLRTVFKISNRIAVMYAGVIVEEGLAQEIMSRPKHPYTSGLLDSMPLFERRKQFFNAIEGKAPLFTDLPVGCKFHPRCRYRIDKCVEKEPDMKDVSEGCKYRCIRTISAELRSATPTKWNY
jgi:oligopeptide/dipeptide ABC transporter ATP-binding protein